MLLSLTVFINSVAIASFTVYYFYLVCIYLLFKFQFNNNTPNNNNKILNLYIYLSTSYRIYTELNHRSLGVVGFMGGLVSMNIYVDADIVDVLYVVILNRITVVDGDAFIILPHSPVLVVAALV